MTAKIITVFNQKGGCGKTMTTMQLSGFYGSRGLKVFVIDMDLQGTSSLWALQAESEVPFPASVLSMAALSDSFVNKLAPIVEKHDVVLIDCPPGIFAYLRFGAHSRRTRYGQHLGFKEG